MRKSIYCCQTDDCNAKAGPARKGNTAPGKAKKLPAITSKVLLLLLLLLLLLR